MAVDDIKHKFLAALRRGTGEPYLLQMAHPDIDFSEEIISCLSLSGYDAQCEGSRAVYLFGLIEKCASNDKIWQDAFRQLDAEEDNDWAYEQLMELAYLRANEKHQDGLRALKRNFAAREIVGARCYGVQYLKALLGIDGLLFGLDKLGQRLLLDPDLSFGADVVDDHFDQPIWQILRDTKNANIQRYLDQLEEQPVHVPRAKRDRSDYLSFLARVEKGRSFGQWEFSDAELLDLKSKFLNETNPEKKANYLQGFKEGNYPGAHVPLLEIVKSDPTEETEYLQYLSLEILKYYEEPAIRNFALKKIKSREGAYVDCISLLETNYQAGDDALLLTLVENEFDEYKIENLASALTDVYKVNPTPDCAGPLLVLYSKMNCSLHREYIVKILFDNGVLPPAILKELEFDCNPETQKLYRLFSAH